MCKIFSLIGPTILAGQPQKGLSDFCAIMFGMWFHLNLYFDSWITTVAWKRCAQVQNHVLFTRSSFISFETMNGSIYLCTETKTRFHLQFSSEIQFLKGSIQVTEIFSFDTFVSREYTILSSTLQGNFDPGKEKNERFSMKIFGKFATIKQNIFFFSSNRFLFDSLLFFCPFFLLFSKKKKKRNKLIKTLFMLVNFFIFNSPHYIDIYS